MAGALVVESVAAGGVLEVEFVVGLLEVEFVLFLPMGV